MDGGGWLTDDLRALLAAIPGPHQVKKRTTVIRLAFALANQQAVKDVFDQPDTCAEAVWYGKWRSRPEIRAAFQACYARALEWRDAETARIQAAYRAQRLQSVARFAASAPAALAEVMSDAGQRGGDRINAAMKLIGLAEPQADAGGLYSPVGSVDQSQTVVIGDNDLDAAIDAELARLAARTKTAAADSPAPAD